MYFWDGLRIFTTMYGTHADTYVHTSLPDLLLTCHARAVLYLAACLQRYVTRDVFYSALLILKPCRACPNIDIEYMHT